MQLGMIGLGRMGANMVRRLQKGGHTCVVYDRNADAVAAVAKEKATPSSSLADLGPGRSRCRARPAPAGRPRARVGRFPRPPR